MNLNLLKSLQSKNDLKQIGFLFYKPTTFEFWFIIVYILLFPFINEKKLGLLSINILFMFLLIISSISTSSIIIYNNITIK